MSYRLASASLVLLLALGCGTRIRAVRDDAGSTPPTDTGSTTPTDGGTTPVDTGTPPPRDSGTTPVDAFAPPVDAGRDAFVVPTDAGADAGRDAGRDAFVAPTDMGTGSCTPLPTTSPLVVTGSVAAGATYNRPQTMCGGPSAVGTSVYYATHVLCSGGASRAYSFALDAAASGGLGDPFVIVYTGTGDVATLACLTSDDDSGTGGGNALATGTVPASTTITVVATDFNNASTGDYTLTITPM